MGHLASQIPKKESLISRQQLILQKRWARTSG